MEIDQDIKDVHGRLPFNGVNEDLMGFGRIHASFVPEKAYIPLKSLPWGEDRFACCLTHDIDNIALYPNFKDWFVKVGGDIKNVCLSRGTVGAKKILAHRVPYLGRFDPCRSVIDGMLRVESDFNATGTYFFKTAESSRYDSAMNLNVVNALIRNVESAGHEAGFHAGYETMFDFDLMKKEKAIFDSMVSNKCYGVRQHYLRLAIPETWRYHEKLGFLYDTSFGYSTHPGFMGGTCYPFRPVFKGRDMNLWVLPLTIMDVTVLCGFSDNLPRLLSVIKILAKEVKRVNGVFVLLWHNSFPADMTSSKWKQYYRDSLRLLQDEGALFCSGRDIIEMWTNAEL